MPLVGMQPNCWAEAAHAKQHTQGVVTRKRFARLHEGHQLDYRQLMWPYAMQPCMVVAASALVERCARVAMGG